MTRSPDELATALRDAITLTADQALAPAEWIATAALTMSEAADEIERLAYLINTPETRDFLEAVMREAGHQRERWGVSHDEGKEDPDWFWLLGYLAGKALHPGIDGEKKRHRIVAAAAALANWHLRELGTDTRMRPGIAPPEDE
jgi:hypothetical protein